MTYLLCISKLLKDIPHKQSKATNGIYEVVAVVSHLEVCPTISWVCSRSMRAGWYLSGFNVLCGCPPAIVSTRERAGMVGNAQSQSCVSAAVTTI